jgi:hypothetical protein
MKPRFLFQDGFWRFMAVVGLVFLGLFLGGILGHSYRVVHEAIWGIPFFFLVSWMLAGFCSTVGEPSSSQTPKRRDPVEVILRGGGIFLLLRGIFILMISLVLMLTVADNVDAGREFAIYLSSNEGYVTGLSIEQQVAVWCAFGFSLLALTGLSGWIAKLGAQIPEQRKQQEQAARQTWLTFALLDAHGGREERISALNQAPEAVADWQAEDWEKAIDDLPYLLMTGNRAAVALWKAIPENREKAMDTAVKTLNAAGAGDKRDRSTIAQIQIFNEMMYNTPSSDELAMELLSLYDLDWNVFMRRGGRNYLKVFGEKAPEALLDGLGQLPPKYFQKHIYGEDLEVIKKLHLHSSDPEIRASAKFLIRRAGWMGRISSLVEPEIV